MINGLCRVFLWTGTILTSNKALVAQDKICLRKFAGGQNLINLHKWNKTTITKQLWALADKKDCLWIRWVHTYYIKNDPLEACESPKISTWAVRKVIDSRNHVMRAPGLQRNFYNRLTSCVKGSKFLIKKLYKAM